MELENMAPLTLEQLRGMRGEWVYIVLIDGEPKSTAWAIVTGEKLVTYLAYNSFEYLIRAVFDVEECGKSFIAYAYPPAHIDRDGWKCPLCETSEVISFEAWEDESKFPKGPSVRGAALFCPHCGKPRTPEAWAELEKRLRG